MTAVIRTIILYLLIIVGIRLMGKRQIGELEPSELVLSLIIADLAAVPMQDFGTPLIMGVIPILTLLCLSAILSVLTVKSIRFRALLCSRPSIVIQDGKIIVGEMRRNRFTIDELMEELDRGASGIHIKGMYTGEERMMVFCVVGKKQIPQLKQIVGTIDPDAFVVVSDAREVLGEGFQTDFS